MLALTPIDIPIVTPKQQFAMASAAEKLEGDAGDRQIKRLLV
jgi:hypothetical protein